MSDLWLPAKGFTASPKQKDPATSRGIERTYFEHLSRLLPSDARSANVEICRLGKRMHVYTYHSAVS